MAKNIKDTKQISGQLEPQVGKPIHYISLGAGVQSSTMALMTACGELEPMVDFAIFADTQDEPKKVYEWLDWLEGQLPFPIYRVSKGSLWRYSTEVRTSKNGNKYLKTALPIFIDNNGSVGKMRRQCTSEMKIEPILRFVKKKIGKKGTAIQWMGISYDEISRMRDSKEAWKTNYYPLIEMRMTRKDCLDWMQAKGYPKPPRSACVYCPYHSDMEWLRLKTEEPEEFQKAIEYEQALKRSLSETAITGTPYLHKSLKPLGSVEFVGNQINMFNEECEGHCGV